MPEEITPELEERLPITEALVELSPDSIWRMEGNKYDNIEWLSDINDMPSKEEVLQKAKEIYDMLPMRALRFVRNARLNEVDWVTLRAIRTKTDIPSEWQEYMDALANLPENSNPKLVDGQLVNVDWPKRPDGVEPVTPPGVRT